MFLERTICSKLIYVYISYRRCAALSENGSSFPVLSCFVPLPPLRFSAPLQEEPADVREEEPHLRLRHGVHHQRHAHRRQSDAEERHGVAVLTVTLGASQSASLHVHASG